MTLQQIIHQKILQNERIASYSIYDEMWYVIKWNRQTFIHYTKKQNPKGEKVLWYFSSGTEPAKFKTQNQEFVVPRII